MLFERLNMFKTIKNIFTKHEEPIDYVFVAVKIDEEIYFSTQDVETKIYLGTDIIDNEPYSIYLINCTSERIPNIIYYHGNLIYKFRYLNKISFWHDRKRVKLTDKELQNVPLIRNRLFLVPYDPSNKDNYQWVIKIHFSDYSNATNKIVLTSKPPEIFSDILNPNEYWDLNNVDANEELSYILTKLEEKGYPYLNFKSCRNIYNWNYKLFYIDIDDNTKKFLEAHAKQNDDTQKTNLEEIKLEMEKIIKENEEMARKVKQIMNENQDLITQVKFYKDRYEYLKEQMGIIDI